MGRNSSKGTDLGLPNMLSTNLLSKNDTLLTELYQAKKWKQALAQCEKRQKKGEKGEFFLVIILTS